MDIQTYTYTQKYTQTYTYTHTFIYKKHTHRYIYIYTVHIYKSYTYSMIYLSMHIHIHSTNIYKLLSAPQSPDSTGLSLCSTLQTNVLNELFLLHPLLTWPTYHRCQWWCISVMWLSIPSIMYAFLSCACRDVSSFLRGQPCSSQDSPCSAETCLLSFMSFLFSPSGFFVLAPVFFLGFRLSMLLRLNFVSFLLSCLPCLDFSALHMLGSAKFIFLI